VLETGGRFNVSENDGLVESVTDAKRANKRKRDIKNGRT
jgi:hypothetical protein